MEFVHYSMVFITLEYSERAHPTQTVMHHKQAVILLNIMFLIIQLQTSLKDFSYYFVLA